MYAFVKDSNENSSLVKVDELHYQSNDQKMLIRSSHNDFYEADVSSQDATNMMSKFQKEDKNWSKGYVFSYVYITNIKFLT